MGSHPHHYIIHIYLSINNHNTTHQQRWLVPSRQPASPLVARPHVSSSPPRPLASPHHLPVVSRSLTGTNLVPSLSVRSVATRSRLSSRSASCLSSAWFVRSPRTSSPTSASRALPSALCRSPLRPTWSRSSKTPTCAPFTPSVSPSSPRTSSLPAVSVASVLKQLDFFPTSIISSTRLTRARPPRPPLTWLLSSRPTG